VEEGVEFATLVS